MRPSTSLMRAALRPQLSRRAVLPPSQALMRCLSSTPRRLAQGKPSEQSAKPQASQPVNNNDGGLPAFSFDGLGISKNLKIFLFVVLSIFGTIETWFWCKAIWVWWKGGSQNGEAEAAKQ